MKKIFLLLLVSSLMVGCGGPVAMLTSGAGFVGSSDTYVRAYNGIDFSTTLITKKDIKTHIYETAKELKKVKYKIYEETLVSSESSASPESSTSPESPVVEKKQTVVFTICYLSFFLALSIGSFVFILLYGFVSLSKTKRKRKVKKKTKRKERR